MARRALKLVSLAAASSGFYLYSSKYLDPNDFGAVRVGRAVATTAVITYDYLTSLRSVPYGSQEYAYLKSQVHLRSAERLRDLCCANRGTFIKVGQHLGALDYLLPEEYTRTLKVLHSQAPQSSMQEIEQVIREDLGKESYGVPRDWNAGVLQLRSEIHWQICVWADSTAPGCSLPWVPGSDSPLLSQAPN
uniref:AarF domain containing kinase 1 n=1 Tax=Gopherus agassizii TaxID=38772 RepID=A0A452H6D6_9SAUR